MWPPRAVWAAVCQQVIPEEARNLSAVPQPVVGRVRVRVQPPQQGLCTHRRKGIPRHSVHPTLLCNFIPSHFPVSSHPNAQLHPILFLDFIPSSFLTPAQPTSQYYPILLPSVIPPSFLNSSHSPPQCHFILLPNFIPSYFSLSPLSNQRAKRHYFDPSQSQRVENTLTSSQEL